jgi:hypothetical protein
MLTADLKTYLENKRVTLVGPSASIASSGQGPQIDGSDAVVRINHQWPIPEKLIPHIGTRMDILYHCCNGDYPVSRLFTPGFERTKFVCYEKGLDTFFIKRECERLGISTVNIMPYYFEMKSILGTYPNTGFVALTHLLKFPIRELYVTGITFFREGYYSGYPSMKARTGLGWAHDTAPQLEYFKKIKDRRLHIEGM